MSLARNVSVTSAVFLAALFSPTGGRSLEPLVPSSDYSAVALRMQQAGFGHLASGRQFLAFDAAGDGRAVEVLGELATADRIAVLVPGSDTTLADFDRGLGGVSRRAPSAQARALYDAVVADHPGARVAVVAWLGYDPPEGLGVAAVRQERAGDGAAALGEFVATLPPHATVTVIGHSYGTVVLALAAPAFDSRVTDLVALASPGLNARLSGELSRHARVWAATAPTDWIGRVPHLRLGDVGHGPIPADAAELPTEGVTGHDGYLTEGSATLIAVADVVAGVP